MSYFGRNVLVFISNMRTASDRVRLISKHLSACNLPSFYVVPCRTMSKDGPLKPMKFEPSTTLPTSLAEGGLERVPVDSMVIFLKSIFTNKDISLLTTEAKCTSFMQCYSGLVIEDKIEFLKQLAHLYGVNQESILAIARGLVAAEERGESILLKAEERLKTTLIPQYQQLFQKIGRLEGGVKFLVDMRADILSNPQGGEWDMAHLRALQLSIRELLSLWFSLGFLSLQRITWESPCDMVQKVSDYEAVHPIKNWSDLKRRVGSYRRCFVFTHNSMSREPVVVLHTALTEQISSNIHSIIKTPAFGQIKPDVSSPLSEDEDGSVTEDLKLIKAAVFYSITATQKGLQGVDLGNYLIKKVVNELQQEFPALSMFSSLSPIPGFKDWLITSINQYLHAEELGESIGSTILLPEEVETLKEITEPENANMHFVLKEVLQKHAWVTNKTIFDALEPILMRLCANYLYLEKRRGYALNPVANFHLTNGAVLWRINWKADLSIRGINQSCGIMVNYRYFMDKTEENSRNYLENNQIAASASVIELASKASSHL